MSEMTNFDDFTRKHLGNYSPEVPPRVWENIIAKKEKKKPYPFFVTFFSKKNLLITVGLVTLLTGVFFMTNNSHDLNEKLNKNEANTNDLNNKQKIKPVTTSDSQQNDLTNTIKEKDHNFNNTTLNPGTSQSEDDLSSLQSASASNKDKHLYKKEKANIHNNLNTAEEFFGEATVLNENKNSSAIRDESNTMIFFLYHPEKIPADDLKDAASAKNILGNLQLPPCPTIEKNAAGNKYYIEVYAGPDYATKSYSDTANSALLQKRKESTSFSSAFSIGFRYTRVFNNGVSFRAGINFSQINEKFSYVQSNIVQITYITDPVTGDTTGTFSTRGTRYKNTINKYHTIDIPLLLGFETGNGRLHANFNAGVVLNIYSWQKGESLDTSFKPVSITTGKGASLYQYKTNIGAGFMGGISVYYKLNDQLHLLAEPYWRYNFSPMNKEMLSLQEKFSTIGLRLGLRLDLN